MGARSPEGPFRYQEVELVALGLSSVRKLKPTYVRKFVTMPGSFLLSDNQE